MSPLSGKLDSLVFGNRRLALIVISIVTIWMGFQASKLVIDAGFEKQLPLDHRYIQTYIEHQKEFGGANRLMIAVRSKQGDMFTPDFFNALKAVTDEVFFLPGVDRSTVTSIFTPNVRFVRIDEEGFAGGNVVPADFAPTPEMISQVKENILYSGQVGRLVANDFSAAMVSAMLVEIDPATGERLDVLKVGPLLEEKIRGPYAQGDIDIHIIGFAKAVGDIAAGAAGVVLFFGIAILITAFLVRRFTHSWKLTLLPLACALITVVWTMGLLTTLGYGLDPMSILVPFLIFAIAMSHGVQMTNAVGSGIAAGGDPLSASRDAFRRLLMPCLIALCSDSVGFLSLLLIKIEVIQELALMAGLGVLMISVTGLVLLPVLLSYQKLDSAYLARVKKASANRGAMWSKFEKLVERGPALALIALALAGGIWGYSASRSLQIGDSDAGLPELHQDSRYNIDTRTIAGSFSIGADIITTIVETVPDGCIEHDVMDLISEFQWRVENVEGVSSAISLAAAAKMLNSAWYEGSPKWWSIPRNRDALVLAISKVETSTGLLNQDCSVIPVIIFADNHRAETIRRITDEVEAFAAEHNSERATFRLATGNAGVIAATNEVVEEVQLEMLLLIYAIVIVLCLIAFRSLVATICIILPLVLTSLLCYGLMAKFGMGLKVTTLPVAALGVGIGVDYGIYIFSEMRRHLKRGESLASSYRHALNVTGNAVLVTGLTLAIGVSTWSFSKLKFQADMGELLTFMFLANMIGALLLLPALATVFLGNRKEPARIEEIDVK